MTNTQLKLAFLRNGDLLAYVIWKFRKPITLAGMHNHFGVDSGHKLTPGTRGSDSPT